MKTAFKHLAKGNFDHGLEALNQCDLWHDDNETLDGPFFLGFPGLSGWGEGLLVASLLKRYADANKKCIDVFSYPEVCSLLKHDDAFAAKPVQDYGGARSHGARSPLSILRAALVGNLLDLPFVKIDTPPNSMDRSGHRIGIAWASRQNGEPTSDEKCIPLGDFLSVFDDGDGNGEVISFQRHSEEEECEKLLGRFGQRVSFVDQMVLDADDQTDVVIKTLSLAKAITVSTTTAHMAACLGVPVILLAARRSGQQWFWRAQGEYGKCIYPTVTVVLGGKGKNWWRSGVPDAKRLFAAMSP